MKSQCNNVSYSFMSLLCNLHLCILPHSGICKLATLKSHYLPFEDTLIYATCNTMYWYMYIRY